LLTPEEKAAGRMFRALCQGGLDAENRESPPHGFALPYWRVVRHECEPAAGASIGITLREHRLASPVYRVCYCGTVGTDAPDFPHWDCDGSKVVAADGLFAFMWKEGRCAGCGRVVRSRIGRVVIAADRPPENGRTILERRQAGPHPGDLRRPRT
jgi:hypothetical protein